MGMGSTSWYSVTGIVVIVSASVSRGLGWGCPGLWRFR